ncbi:anti-sigma factor [Salipiger abyssi]|uniref:anti-sigma factor n=1 Tax=Salipiger abyssi TaxID=1250539 RepID=UPI00360AE5BA
MTDAASPLGEDDIALAGEYVLGTLELDERRAVARRIAKDSAFAVEVARWEARLDPLADEVRPIAPPAHVWKGVERGLFGAPRTRSGLWGWFAGASGLAAALLAAVLWLGEPLPTQQGPLWISDMVSEDGEVRLAALYDEGRGEMRVSMGGDGPGDGRDFELWLIQGDEVISLGVMPHEGQAAMPIPENLRDLVANATLAITDEPTGGSPTGVATGPIVAAAPLRRI